MGTRHFRPPIESTSLNRSLKNLAKVITSTTGTAVQNLVEIRSWVASGQIGEISRKFSYLYPFLSNSPTGQTVHHIFTLKCRGLTQRCSFLALVDIAPHFEDQIAPKPPIFGARICIFQPNESNIEMFIL